MARKLRAAAIFALSVALLFPTYWMIVGSFQTLEGVMRLPPELIPRSVTFSNYTFLLTKYPVARWFLNTMGLTVVSVVLSVISVAMAGYAFSVYKSKWLSLVYMGFLISLMLPRTAMVIPQFVVFSKLNLSTNMVGALVPLLYFPIGILLFRVQAETIPKSLRDAARMDGASDWQHFIHVVLPLCKPTVGILIITKAYEAIGDYLWQSLVLTKGTNMTAMVGLVMATMRRSDMRVNPISVNLAAGVLMFLPLLAVFLVFQRSFKHSLLGGAIKE